MDERSDIEDFFWEIDPDLCQYAYAIHDSGFISTVMNISSFRNENFLVNIFALQSDKLQMFDEQSCCV